MLLELASQAYGLFQKQEPREKRRLLDFLCSNSSWRGGELTITLRQPFDMLADANEKHLELVGAGASEEALRQNWLPG